MTTGDKVYVKYLRHNNEGTQDRTVDIECPECGRTEEGLSWIGWSMWVCLGCSTPLYRSYGPDDSDRLAGGITYPLKAKPEESKPDRLDRYRLSGFHREEGMHVEFFPTKEEGMRNYRWWDKNDDYEYVQLHRMVTSAKHLPTDEFGLVPSGFLELVAGE